MHLTYPIGIARDSLYQLLSQNYAVQYITSKRAIDQLREDDHSSTDNKIVVRETSLLHHVNVAGILSFFSLKNGENQINFVW